MSTLVTSPRARYDFEILETLTAGVSLLGTEVASLKKNQGKLIGSYVKLIKGVPMLLGAYIPPFQVANAPKDYSPTRDRALLLNKKEIAKLERELHEKNLTLIPLRFFRGGPHIKLEIALAKGKKKFDKRETIKKRDISRDIARKI
ncbi:SsrA-binding protein [Candidatus Kaiserbacteria bacterium RIFCSPHIGHO2_02_FULL_49_34]|uniref:SsrA-binding protein n=1 Tax=Candidatus Kaiserbacteria bacterium RIFCSPHIGHO2_02_FULL_49_34 TaxID=1798491 RepID=A0A1F6DLK0_9BACT|nr:MAG: SsrA-binding protein [Candidatus Kaiserbacteria bacterium RIFCSPHIGHO2_02_FULL_49_34]